MIIISYIFEDALSSFSSLSYPLYLQHMQKIETIWSKTMRRCLLWNASNINNKCRNMISKWNKTATVKQNEYSYHATFFSYFEKYQLVRKRPYICTPFDIRQNDSTGGAAPDMECLYYIPRKTFGKCWIFESHVCKAICYNNLCVGGLWITWLFWMFLRY